MPGDANMRIGLCLAASLLSLAAAAAAVRWKKGLSQRDLAAAALLFLPVLAADAAVMLAAPGARFLPPVIAAVYLGVFAAAIVLVKKGGANAVGAFVLAVVLRILLQYIVLWVYGLCVE